MFQTTQCTNVPIVASGSSQIKARNFVFAGMSNIVNGGETFSPSQVYLGGICPLCWNALLVSFNSITSVPIE